MKLILMLSLLFVFGCCPNDAMTFEKCFKQCDSDTHFGDPVQTNDRCKTVICHCKKR